MGADGIPECTDFKLKEWLDYLADNRRSMMNLFHQELNTWVLYEASSQGEYEKAHGTGSQANSNSSQSTDHTAGVPPAGSTTPTLVLRTVCHLSFNPAAGTSTTSNITASPNVFMQRVRANTATAPTGSLGGGSGYVTKLQKPSVASQDISWNGKPEKFPKLKERVEGHFIQALMGHCVHAGFIKSYMKDPTTLLVEYPDFDLTKEQLRSDNHVMFGALKWVAIAWC